VSKQKFLSNPFNVLLIVTGVAFGLTALAFGMMTFLSSDPALAQEHLGQAHPLWRLLAEYGDEAMYVELGVLAVCTAGTILVDIRSES
jgi:hypothetical protein